jgi:hypothetical protein
VVNLVPNYQRLHSFSRRYKRSIYNDFRLCLSGARTGDINQYLVRSAWRFPDRHCLAHHRSNWSGYADGGP